MKGCDNVEPLKSEWEAGLSKSDQQREEATINRLNGEIRITEKELNIPFKERVERAAASLWEVYSKAKQQLSEQPGELTERIKKNKRESDQNLVDIQQEIELSGGAPPYKTMWDTFKVLVFVIVLVTAFEYYPNYLAFRILEASDLGTFFICMGYSLLQAISCHLTGLFLGERRDLPLKENVPALLSGISGLIMVLIAIILRSRAETSEAVNLLDEMAQNAGFVNNQDILALWNLVGWGIAILVSRRIHQHSNYWSLRQKEMVLAIEKDEFTTAENIREMKRKDLDQIYSAKTHNQAIAEQNELQERLSRLNEKKSEAEARLEIAKDRYESYRNIGIAAIQAAFEKGRSLSGI